MTSRSAVRIFCGMAALLATVSVNPAHAAWGCSALTNEISAAEITELRADILDVVPLLHFERAQMVAIVMAPDGDTEIAPYSTPTATGYSVVIPQGFRELQCKLILIQMLFHLSDELNTNILKNMMKNCVVRGTPVPQCVNHIPDEIYKLIQEEWGKENDEALSKSIINLTNYALYYIVLHEYGHILLSHFEKDVEDPELDADIFAVTNGQFSDFRPLSAFATYSMLGLADDYVPASELHGAFVCRARVLSDVIKAIDKPLLRFRLWAILDPQEHDEHFATNEGPTALDAVLLPDQQQSAAGCPVRRRQSARIAAIERELNALVARAAEIRRGSPVDPFVIVDELNAVRLTTDVARSARVKFISVQLKEIHGSADLEVLRPRLRKYVATALASDDARFLLSGDYGRLLALQTVDSYEDYPRGSKIDDVTAQLRSRFDKALRYAPRIAVIYLWASRVEFLAGRCETGLAYLKRSRGTLPTRRSVGTKSRESDAKSDEVLDGAIADIERVMASRGCDVVMESFRSVVRRDYGWID